MKTIAVIACSLLLLAATRGLAQSAPSPSDSLLVHIQNKIHQAMAESFRSQSAAKLGAIEKELKAKESNRIVQYWRAYTLYYETIYYMRTNDKKAGQKALNNGINILKKITPKGSEDYALLAMMQAFSIQFTGGVGAAALSQKATKNARKAVKLDKKNVRAWYVRGALNFHTPKQFRRKTIVEKCLKKAISLKGENRTNPYMPTWGKARAYGLLASYYIKNDRRSDAKKLLKEGLKKYPENRMLKRISMKLENE